jgi:hypothetical protein
LAGARAYDAFGVTNYSSGTALTPFELSENMRLNGSHLTVTPVNRALYPELGRAVTGWFRLTHIRWSICWRFGWKWCCKEENGGSGNGGSGSGGGRGAARPGPCKTADQITDICTTPCCCYWDESGKRACEKKVEEQGKNCPPPRLAIPIGKCRARDVAECLIECMMKSKDPKKCLLQCTCEKAAEYVAEHDPEGGLTDCFKVNPIERDDCFHKCCAPFYFCVASAVCEGKGPVQTARCFSELRECMRKHCV